MSEASSFKFVDNTPPGYKYTPGIRHTRAGMFSKQEVVEYSEWFDELDHLSNGEYSSVMAERFAEQFSEELTYNHGKQSKYTKYDRARKTARNYLMCGKRDARYVCGNHNTEGCGHEHRIIAYCKIKYCDHLLCVKNRYIEALQKLVSFKIRSKQLFHYSIGSNRMSMSDVRIYTNRVILSMRRKGWTMTTIRVLDIDARNSEIKGVNFYHVHIAQFGEAIDVKKFNTDIRASIKRINDDLVFSIFGWRPQRNVFEYFAKRIACQFGHKDKEGIYFLPEVMDFKEFVETYHNKKILTLSDPEGLINIKGDVAKKLMCPICEIPLIYAGLTTEGHEKDEKRKPPW